MTAGVGEEMTAEAVKEVAVVERLEEQNESERKEYELPNRIFQLFARRYH